MQAPEKRSSLFTPVLGFGPFQHRSCSIFHPNKDQQGRTTIHINGKLGARLILENLIVILLNLGSGSLHHGLHRTYEAGNILHCETGKVGAPGWRHVNAMLITQALHLFGR